MDWRGYNGTISADASSLTLTHSGIVAKAAGLRCDEPRRISLAAVSDVRLKRATRLVNGHLTLGVGGAPAADVGSQAAAHHNTVMFRYKDAAAFDQLHAWLQQIVDHNRRSGHDQSIVPVDPAGETRMQRLDARAARLQASIDDAAATREEAQLEKMAGLLGDDRPDIVAAAARMGWRFGGKRELKKLTEHLHAGEQVERIVQGTYEGDEGVLVLTDLRLLFLFHGLVRQAKEDFPLRLISSVQTKIGFATGEIRIFVSGNTAAITNIFKDDVEPMAAAVRQRIAGSPASPNVVERLDSPTPTAPSGGGADILEQVRKLGELHAAGVLTDDEFATKKAELLDRL